MDILRAFVPLQYWPEVINPGRMSEDLINPMAKKTKFGTFSIRYI